MKNLTPLNRVEMKKITGGTDPVNCPPGYIYDPITDMCVVGRCKSDVICHAFGPYNGTCEPMQTGQCRCVNYENGTAVESVPWEDCKILN